MGAWGIGLFSNDTACDVREEFRHSIAEGLSTESASAQILDKYMSIDAEPEDRSKAVVALAVTQWRTGRLLDDVKRAAIESIDAGGDLSLWAGDAKQLEKRRNVLAKVREQLLSPQRDPVHIGKKVLSVAVFTPGDVVIHTHRSGAKFVLWMYQNEVSTDGTASRAELLDIEASKVVSDPRSVVSAPLRSDYDGRGMATDTMGINFWNCQYWDRERYEIVARIDRPEARRGSPHHFKGSFVPFSRKSKKNPQPTDIFDQYLEHRVPLKEWPRNL